MAKFDSIMKVETVKQDEPLKSSLAEKLAKALKLPVPKAVVKGCGTPEGTEGYAQYENALDDEA